MDNTAPRRRATGGAMRRIERPSRAGTLLRRCCFRLSNWTQAEYDAIVAHSPNFKWMIMGKEISPETGTPHLQGAIVFGTQLTFTRVKALPGLARAHVEPMGGTPADSLVYCSKEDPAPYIFGEMPEPGKRTDIAMAVERVQAGASLRDLAAGDNAVAVVKFCKGLTVLRSLLSKPRDPASPPEIYWVHGATGTHKTRRVFELGQRLCPGNVWISSGNLRWFDGYDGQRVAILDDFRPDSGVQFHFILRLLDRYPMSVEFKGGFVNWAPQFIFITTPYTVSETFASTFARPEDILQLERRVTETFSFPDDHKKWDDLFALRGDNGLENVQPVVAAPPAPVPSAPPMTEEEEEEWIEDEISQVISPIRAIELSSDSFSFEHDSDSFEFFDDSQ